MNSRRYNSAEPARALLALLALTSLLGCDRRDTATDPATREPAVPPSKQFAEISERGHEAENGDTRRDSKLPVYELKMDPTEVVALERTAHSDQTHPATFLAGTNRYENAQVRYRGAWSRSWPKKPLKVFFDHAQPFEKHHSLNFNSAWRDPAFIREPLAYYVYAACGVPAPRAQMVRIDLNGHFRGIYVQVEQPDKTLLTRFDLKGATLFKAVSRSNQSDERELGREDSYAAHYERESQKPGGFQELQAFCRDLAQAPNALEFFESHVDLEKYINYLAATALIQHWDGFNKNHFLLYDGHGSKKWFVIPWDLDRTFGDHWDSSFNQSRLSIALGTHQQQGITGWNRLEDRFFSDPPFRTQFLDRLQELLQHEFTTEKLFPVVDQLESQITADAPLDRRRWPPGTQPADLRPAITQVKRFIEDRRVFLLNEIPKLRRNIAMAAAME